jgi:hypothetical protein
MGMKLEDGKGRGFEVAVTDKNRLETQAVTRTGVESQNGEGLVWSLVLDGLAPSGATYFFYLLNTGVDTLEISQIGFASSVAGTFRLEKVTGTAAGGTAIVPVTLNLGSSHKPDITLLSGTSITGLTAAGLLAPIYLAANVRQVYEPAGGIYIPANTAIAIKAPAAAVVNGSIVVYLDGH